MKRINFDDAKIGDKVKISRTKDTGVVVTYEGTLEYLTDYNLALEPWAGFGREVFEDGSYELYLIERPYALPTEPGLYTTASDKIHFDDGSAFVLRLNNYGIWYLWDTKSVHQMRTAEEIMQEVKRGALTLTKLTMIE